MADERKRRRWGCTLEWLEQISQDNGDVTADVAVGNHF